MGKNIDDIKNDFDVARRTVNEIKQFIFDNMSAMNADKQQDMLAMLFKPPVSNYAGRDWKDWKIDFFIFDLWNENSDNETRTLTQVWANCEAKGMLVINKICENVSYGLVNPVSEPSFDYGYPIMNDKLVAVRFRFTLRAWAGCE